MGEEERELEEEERELEEEGRGSWMEERERGGGQFCRRCLVQFYVS